MVFRIIVVEPNIYGLVACSINIKEMAHEKKVFICYETTTGLSFAKHLKISLRNMKMPSFVAAEDLRAGDIHEDNIRENAIKECKYFVVVVTLSALESEEVKKEISMAGKYKKKIIPCKHKKIDRAMLSRLPIIFEDRLQQIDFEDKEELANNVILEIHNIEKPTETIESESISTTENHIRYSTSIERNNVKTHISDLKDMVRLWKQSLNSNKVALAEERFIFETIYARAVSDRLESSLRDIENHPLFEDIFHHFPNLKDLWIKYKTLRKSYNIKRERLLKKMQDHIEPKLKEQRLNLGSEQNWFIFTVYRGTILRAKGKNEGFYSDNDVIVGGVKKKQLYYKNSETDGQFQIAVIEERIDEVRNIHKEMIKECVEIYLSDIKKIIELENKTRDSHKKLEYMLDEKIYLTRFDQMDCKFVK